MWKSVEMADLQSFYTNILKVYLCKSFVLRHLCAQSHSRKEQQNRCSFFVPLCALNIILKGKNFSNVKFYNDPVFVNSYALNVLINQQLFVFQSAFF